MITDAMIFGKPLTWQESIGAFMAELGRFRFRIVVRGSSYLPRLISGSSHWLGDPCPDIGAAAAWLETEARRIVREDSIIAGPLEATSPEFDGDGYSIRRDTWEVGYRDI